jgi:hypothetical protein
VLHDALACMFKFSDDVCLEARKDKVRNAHSRAVLWCSLAELMLSRLVDPHNAQHFQVGICLLLLRRQQVLLAL